MNNSILVIGVGKGLGSFLVESIADFKNRIAVSRSPINVNAQHIMCTASELASNLGEIKQASISLVIYVPSAWGETGEVKLSEFEKFMEIGPKGVISSFNALKEKMVLKKGALFVSIGSTASEKVMSTSSGLSSPIYSIAKSTQKAIVAQLSRANREYRFATITLGSIGENNDKDGVGYENIKNSIEFLYGMSSGVSYTEIELVAKSDIK